MPSETTLDPSPDLSWANAIEKLRPYVFRITTQRGHGSGYLLTTRKSGLCGIATAWHVVDHEDEWDLPIKIKHDQSNTEVTLLPKQRIIHRNADRDVALIVFNPMDFPDLPKKDLTMGPQKKFLKQGLSIGWLGFPSVADNLVCFFEGKVSAWDHLNEYYLVDGVAINGVSGGPAFRVFGDSIDMLGCVSAYIPNRISGEALPGLCVVQGIAPFYEFIERIKSIEEVDNKAATVSTEQAAKSS